MPLLIEKGDVVLGTSPSTSRANSNHGSKDTLVENFKRISVNELSTEETVSVPSNVYELLLDGTVGDANEVEEEDNNDDDEVGEKNIPAISNDIDKPGVVEEENSPPIKKKKKKSQVKTEKIETETMKLVEKIEELVFLIILIFFLIIFTDIFHVFHVIQ